MCLVRYWCRKVFFIQLAFRFLLQISWEWWVQLPLCYVLSTGRTSPLFLSVGYSYFNVAYILLPKIVLWNGGVSSNGSEANKFLDRVSSIFDTLFLYLCWSSQCLSLCSEQAARELAEKEAAASLPEEGTSSEGGERGAGDGIRGGGGGQKCRSRSNSFRASVSRDYFFINEAPDSYRFGKVLWVHENCMKPVTG